MVEEDAHVVVGDGWHVPRDMLSIRTCEIVFGTSFQEARLENILMIQINMFICLIGKREENFLVLILHIGFH